MLNLNFDPFPVLFTERLVLRQLTQGDAGEIFMLRSDEDVNRFIDRKRATAIDDAVKFIDKINNVVTSSEGMFWGINKKNDSSLIGTICYWNILQEEQCAEIGYELLPAFQGKGIMQEAIQKVINFGFENMKLEIITAFTHFDNHASIRLLEKNNFTRDKKSAQEKIPEAGNYAIYTLSNPVDNVPVPG